ncbi:MAG: hypothetical protein J5990_04090 [Bacteroidales bacterium]|nr:hypothetical protein [Bacteroidales bacterium]
MKRLTKAFIVIAAGIAAIAAASCSKDNTIRYNNATMGNVANGKFTSDQGNIFNVIEQTCQGKLDTMKRAFIICDVLNNTEGIEGEYDVRLNYLAPVLTKEALPASGITEENKPANDPILLRNHWISGGYINILLAVPIVVDSKITHTINFIYEDNAQSDGAYTFTISHDCNGEVFNETNESRIEFAYAYVSTPVASIIKEKDARIILKWLNYKVEGNAVILSETVEHSREMLYSADTFQQVPEKAQMFRSLINLN